jgi:hypothetical protein
VTCAGFPAWWPTAVLGRHATGDGPSAGGAGGIRGTRAEGERGEDDWGSEGDNLAQQEGFENARDLVGDLLGAKNASVTNLPHLK